MSRSKIAKNAEFGPPRTIDDVQFEELMAGFGVEGMARRQLIDRLQLIVAHFQRVISEEESTERERTRKGLQDTADRLAWAAKAIGNSGAVGKEILRLTAPAALSPMFSLTWLQQEFPGHDMLPSAPNPRSRIKRRLRSADKQEDASAEAKYYFTSSKWAGDASGRPLTDERFSSAGARAFEISW
jgi:hypothetical protein